MRRLTLHTATGNHCDILFDEGSSLDHRPIEDAAKGHRRIIVIMDANVEEHYGNLFPWERICITATEANKSWEMAGSLIEQLIAMRADKDTLLVGMGGGITTDLTGFVASIYKRGVPFALVPTTLLSMADAAIGGKNGVNISSFKNMAGVIQQPEWVYINSRFLQTFTKEALFKGISELLKVYIIAGKHYFEAADFFVEQYRSPLFQTEHSFREWQRFIAAAVEIKCQVVARDEREGDQRRLLNLGHTLAHALEHVAPTLSHGEAVAIGMVWAAERAGFPHLTHLTHTLQTCGLPTAIPDGIDKAELQRAIVQDKKVRAGGVTLVLPHDLDKVTLEEVATDRLFS